jgi:hypothetical protein
MKPKKESTLLNAQKFIPNYSEQSFQACVPSKLREEFSWKICGLGSPNMKGEL